MKNRTLYWLSALSMIPFFIACIVNSILAITYWMDKEEWAKYLAGHLNNQAIAIVNIGGVLALAIMATTLLALSNVSGKLDSLDKAIQELEQEKKLYVQARTALCNGIWQDFKKQHNVQ